MGTTAEQGNSTTVSISAKAKTAPAAKKIDDGFLNRLSSLGKNFEDIFDPESDSHVKHFFLDLKNCLKK